MKKVSIIVAAFNVEDYIEKCILSLINQTYKSIEVIVVNDGSTDKTREIIENIKQKHQDIIIINKHNGGLSSARNEGLKIATGEYIAFVDGDDFVDEKMYEKMLINCEENCADISICGFIRVYSNRNIYNCTNESKIIASKECLKRMLISDGIYDYAWDKLYKRELFNGIAYPEGKLFEDVYTTYKTVVRANKIFLDSECYYYYNQRNGSILRSTFNIRKMDCIEAINEIADFVYQNNLGLDKEVKIKRLYASLNMILGIAKSKVFLGETTFDSLGNELFNYLRQNKYLFWSIKNNRMKILFLLSLLGLNMFTSIIKVILAIKKIRFKLVQTNNINM